MPSDAKTLILHIGSNKTGSSALQAGLDGSRDALARSGVCYPRAGVLSGAHHLLAASVHPNAWRMHADLLPEDRHRHAIETAREMEREAQEAGCDRLLVSSEYLWGILPIWSHAQLVGAFPGWSIEILALIRHPKDWAVSSWLQSVKSGQRRDFGAYVRQALSKPRTALRYDWVISNWQNASRAARTHVVLYEDVKDDLMGGVSRRLDLGLEGGAAPKRNRSPSAEEVERLLAVNRSDAPDLDKARERSRIMRSGAKDGPPWIAQEADLDEVMALAAPGLRRLAKREGMGSLYGT